MTNKLNGNDAKEETNSEFFKVENAFYRKLEYERKIREYKDRIVVTDGLQPLDLTKITGNICSPKLNTTNISPIPPSSENLLNLHIAEKSKQTKEDIRISQNNIKKLKMAYKRVVGKVPAHLHKRYKSIPPSLPQITKSSQLRIDNHGAPQGSPELNFQTISHHEQYLNGGKYEGNNQPILSNGRKRSSLYNIFEELKKVKVIEKVKKQSTKYSQYVQLRKKAHEMLKEKVKNISPTPEGFGLSIVPDLNIQLLNTNGDSNDLMFIQPINIHKNAWAPNERRSKSIIQGTDNGHPVDTKLAKFSQINKMTREMESTIKHLPMDYYKRGKEVNQNILAKFDEDSGRGEGGKRDTQLGPWDYDPSANNTMYKFSKRELGSGPPTSFKGSANLTPLKKREKVTKEDPQILGPLEEYQNKNNPDHGGTRVNNIYIYIT